MSIPRAVTTYLQRITGQNPAERRWYAVRARRGARQRRPPRRL